MDDQSDVMDRKGIGVILEWKPRGWIVQTVLRESPAEKAGVKTGALLKMRDGLEITTATKEFSELGHEALMMFHGTAEHSLSIPTESLRVIVQRHLQLVPGFRWFCKTCGTCRDVYMGVGSQDCDAVPCHINCAVD